ncbi:MAG TPA: hypothetical protein ENN84_05345 [Candidatus Marinimicrobia bacterium]|nr:hypothetical protein [Candidatus Neomarinimicrobiota bacterium]
MLKTLFLLILFYLLVRYFFSPLYDAYFKPRQSDGELKVNNEDAPLDLISENDIVDAEFEDLDEKK